MISSHGTWARLLGEDCICDQGEIMQAWRSRGMDSEQRCGSRPSSTHRNSPVWNPVTHSNPPQPQQELRTRACARVRVCVCVCVCLCVCVCMCVCVCVCVCGLCADFHMPTYIVQSLGTLAYTHRQTQTRTHTYTYTDTHTPHTNTPTHTHTHAHIIVLLHLLTEPFPVHPAQTP